MITGIATPVDLVGPDHDKEYVATRQSLSHSTDIFSRIQVYLSRAVC